MREIKFRMFIESKDGRNKFMTNALYHTSHIIDLNDFNKEFAKNGEFVGPKKVTYSQFTGIKAFDGGEIYEGDVIEEVVSNTPRRFKVVWDDYGMFLFVPLYKTDIGAIDYYELEAEFGEIVVVGNFYENPELLEVR